MKLSTDRILTTHVGSLPRPGALIDMLEEQHKGGEFDPSKLVGPTAVRPCVRRVPAMTAVRDAVYLFGGLDLTSGPDERGPLVGFNDLWSGRMGQE